VLDIESWSCVYSGELEYQPVPFHYASYNAVNQTGSIKLDGWEIAYLLSEASFKLKYAKPTETVLSYVVWQGQKYCMSVTIIEKDSKGVCNRLYLTLYSIPKLSWRKRVWNWFLNK
jgi:hypothetical protein